MTEPTDHIKPLSEKTKWVIAGSFLVVFAGLQWVIYHMGYNRGWEDGSEVPPLRIVEQSDEKAMKTLAQFMAESASGPEALERLLANRDSDLLWIRDDKLRSEVVWGLARELLVEGREEPALQVIHPLIGQGMGSGDAGKWAQRAEQTGSLLLSREQGEKSIPYLEAAAREYKQAGLHREEAACLEKLVRTLLDANRLDHAVTALSRLNELSADQPARRSRILASMGRISRQTGKSDAARQYFSQAMEVSPAQSADAHEDMGYARISMAEALLESGRASEAEPLFRSGLESMRGSRTDLSYTLSALRGLARIEADRQEHQKALALLYQAEGAARGQVAPNEPFWPCLYDQRGWLLLAKSDPDEALKDFSRAANAGFAPDARVQSNEGAGMACLELGKINEAYQYLSRATSILEKDYPHDKSSLGRLYKNLGTTCDLLGRNQEALKYYDQSAAILAGLDDPLYTEALLCKAHTLSELEQWSNAVEAFATVIPLLQGERKTETLKCMADCYDNLGMRDKGDECWREAGYPRVVPSKKRR